MAQVETPRDTELFNPTKLTCDACNETFNLLGDGGKLERTQDPADGHLHNIKTLCAGCNADDIAYQARISVARRLLEGTGYEITAT
jgi:hypothetical protein